MMWNRKRFRDYARASHNNNSKKSYAKREGHFDIETDIYSIFADFTALISVLIWSNCIHSYVNSDYEVPFLFSISQQMYEICNTRRIFGYLRFLIAIIYRSSNCNENHFFSSPNDCQIHRLTVTCLIQCDLILWHFFFACQWMTRWLKLIGCWWTAKDQINLINPSWQWDDW